jgi:hypothetical protein
MKKKEALGFVIAPVVPAALFSLYGSFHSSIWETVWAFFAIVFVAYIFTVALGLPVYFYLLKKKNIQSLFQYCLAGLIVGVITYLLIFLPVIISNMQYGLEHLYLTVKNNIGFVVLASLYGIAVEFIFWILVIKPSK